LPCDWQLDVINQHWRAAKPNPTGPKYSLELHVWLDGAVDVTAIKLPPTHEDNQRVTTAMRTLITFALNRFIVGGRQLANTRDDSAERFSMSDNFGCLIAGDSTSYLLAPGAAVAGSQDVAERVVVDCPVSIVQVPRPAFRVLEVARGFPQALRRNHPSCSGSLLALRLVEPFLLRGVAANASRFGGMTLVVSI
jgi:hypothetical protein